MSDTIQTRHILAAVHGDRGGDASYVLFEICFNDIALAFAAKKVALSFDESPVAEGRFGGTILQTPGVGCEHVLCYLPEWLSEWVEDQGDVNIERVHLLPSSMNDQLEHLKRSWRSNEHGIAWGSRNCRFQCGADSVRLAIDDKYTDDVTVWTLNFLPILDELSQAFDRMDMSCDGEGVIYEEVGRG